MSSCNLSKKVIAILTLFTLIFSILATHETKAQYNLNWAEAPLNKIPIQYKLEHFNFKGPVKEYIQGTTNYKFDNRGYFDSGKAYTYTNYAITFNDKNLPLTYKKWVGDAYVNPNRLVLDSKGHIVAQKKNLDDVVVETYTYDSQGNWTGTLDANGKAKNYIYSYDDKNRLIRSQFIDYTGKVSWVEEYRYEKDGDFLIISTVRKKTGETGEAVAKKEYYKNGFYYGTSKDATISFDKNGNLTRFITGNDNPPQYSYARFIYY